MSLSPKVFDILMVLVRNGGHIVQKDQLMTEVWPDAFVEEANLNVGVSSLRKALGDTPDGHTYIETIPRRGYRFVAPVAKIADEPKEVMVQRRTMTRIVQEEEEIDTGDDLGENSSSDTSTAMMASVPNDSIPAPLIDHEAIQVVRQNIGSSRAQNLRKLIIGVASAAVLAAGGYFSRDVGRKGASPRPERVMLAVLPFVNLSGDRDQEYFADGLTEEMISQLGSLNPSRLGVIARTSAMTYKHTSKTVDQIGRELGVDYILEGSVRRSENRLRITAQLIQTSDQTHLWAESYDRDFEDMLKLEGDVSQSIAKEIRVQLRPHEKLENVNPSPVNNEAHEDFLKGRFIAHQRTMTGFYESIEYYNQAVVKDPKYAPAYAGLADSYTLLGLYNVRLEDVMPKAESAAAKALELDSSLAEAHASMAGVKAMYDWDWRGAEREFKRAIDLNPSYAEAHHSYAILYCVPRGRKQETIEHMELAVKLDPLSPIIVTDLGWAYFLAGQTNRAIAQYDKALELENMFSTALFRLEQAFVKKGMYKEALTMNDENPSFPKEVAAAMDLAYQRGGYRGALKAKMDTMTKIEKRGVTIDPYFFAFAYAQLGDYDRALDELEKACERRSPNMIYLETDPPFESLHGDARFENLARRVGLTK